MIGVDLVSNPELALDANISAKIFALYWHGRDIQSMCDREDWTAARRAVNGGTNGLDRFTNISVNLVNSAKQRGLI